MIVPTNRVQFGMPLTDYLAAPGLSKHVLDLLHEAPELYKAHIDGTYSPEQTRPMLIGRLLHSLILEHRVEFIAKPETYEKDGETKPWNGRASWCADWVREQKETIVSQEEADSFCAIERAVSDDPKCQELLSKGEPEVSLFSDKSGRLLKCRVDWVGSDYFVDLKTTTDASAEEFSREIYSRRYHVQAALQIKIAGELDMPQRRWFVIAVQKGPRPMLNVRELHPNAIELGRYQLDDDLKLLKQCEDSGNWFGLSGESKKIERLDVPQWAHHQYASKGLDALAIAGEKMFQD